MGFARLQYSFSTNLPGGGNKNGITTSSFFPNVLPVGSVVFSPETITQQENALGNPENVFMGNDYLPKKTKIYNLTTNTEIEDTESPLVAAAYSVTYSIYKQIGIVKPTQNSFKLTYTFVVLDNRLPPKKWTITDVIKRCCEVLEPLRAGERPRFRLQGVKYGENDSYEYETGTQAEEFDKILAPEFAFTKMTFREQMKQAGGFIHGEPRITAEKVDEQGNSYYEFAFDKYGGKRLSKLKNFKPYVTKTLKTDINEYCTALDSSASNLVNQLDWAQGVITEPCADGSISLRTESTYVRMSDDEGTFIPTKFPIYAIKKVELVSYSIGDEQQTLSPPADITAYVFENADYSLLSSYDEVFPFSKAYALKYTQGQKNITGLFFKPENAINSIFSNYAITNIINATVGENYQNLEDGTIRHPINYPTIAVRVTYLPIYNTRVSTNKSYIEGGLPSTIAYNQGSSLVETRYYGENLKGVVQRLGNVEKSYTYHLAFLSDIPKIGMLFDERYYISAVSVEYLPAYIKCTVGLSKDFNRLSEYVGVSSNLRLWEVSEKQAVARESILTEYVKTTENSQDTDEEVAYPFDTVSMLFNKYPLANQPVSLAKILTYTKKNDTINSEPLNDIYVALPVISSSFGNSLSFDFEFADNYSAGQKSEYLQAGLQLPSGSGMEGYWGVDVPYSDYYGRFYYAQISLYAGNLRKAKQPFQYPQNSRDDDYSIYSSYQTDGADEPVASIEWKYRKDNREIPQISYEIQAVTDDEDTIIGSALMSNCCLVSTANPTYYLYGFKERLNVLDRQINIEKLVEDGIAVKLEEPIYNADNIVLPSDDRFIAWAIVTEGNVKTIKVVNDNGEEIEQEIHEGDELVIGQNKPLTGQTLYFRKKRSIYDKT